MNDLVQFETPENITVTYRLAGPGTRFLAFFFDSLIIICAFIALAAVMVGLAFAFPEQAEAIGPYVFGIVFAIGFGFANIAYYAVFEWVNHGHTVGKRLAKIRVVADEGFSLTLSGVVIRNIFRLVDTVPLLWFVPVVTRKMQRFGDMVGGTIVISDRRATGSALRDALALRRPEEAVYTFGGDALGRLTEVDVLALDLFLERRGRLHPDHRSSVAAKLVRGITRRLDLIEPDGTIEHERFLEDLLAAYARREARELG